MCGSMADIQSATAEIRRGKKEERKKPPGKNIMCALFHGATIKSYVWIIQNILLYSTNSRGSEIINSYLCNI